MSHRNEMVWILLATYNGEQFLQDFLNSLLTLYGVNWKVLAYDDGSADNSVRILKHFSARHPEKLDQLPSRGDAETGGACQAFSYLSEAVLKVADSGDLIMFADQDDIWAAQKIVHMMDAYHGLPASIRCGPVLLHSDLNVVDESGQELAGSLMALQKTNPLANDLRHLLVQNVVTGCAAMVNRELLARACPIPADAVMHDWWIALVAAGQGHIEYLDETLVAYRQHSANVVGAKRYGLVYILRHLLHTLRFGHSDRLPLSALMNQARALTRHPVFDTMSAENQQLISVFAGLPSLSVAQRLHWLYRAGVRRCGHVRNLVLFVDAWMLSGEQQRHL